jgi:TrmH family RNA methyltransferase
MFERIKIVLVGTTHAGNIGAAARAMKVMGLKRLVLVQPKNFPSAEASARASGADDVLAQAQVCGNLAEAIADCQWVIGSSARDRSIQWPCVSPRQCAEQLAIYPQTAAIVFGREHSGLRNDELDYCQHLLRIDTAGDYASLNLAAAVQVVSYELYQAAQQPAPNIAPIETRVDQETMGRFYQHLEQTLIAIDFLNPDNPRHLMRRLRRLYHKAAPTLSEMNILRGILTATQRMPHRHDDAKKPTRSDENQQIIGCEIE